MALTVRELVEIPHLATRLIAGRGGADREIVWAHSVELGEPWDWMGHGELLMTIGLGIPATPEAQEHYVRQLAAAGLAGVAIGERMAAPPLSDAMLAAADAVDLPIVRTRREVPFSEVSRAVAAAARGPEQQRLGRIARIYELVRRAVSDGLGATELLRTVGRELDCALTVVRDDRATPVFPDAEAVPEATREALLRTIAEHGDDRPGILHVPTATGEVSIVPLATRFRASLLATGDGQLPSYAVLQHVATVASMEVERLFAERERQRRLGAQMLGQLVDGRIASGAADVELRGHGLDRPPFAILLAAGGAAGAAATLHHDLVDSGVPHLLGEREDLVCCLTTVAASEAAIGVLGAAWERVGTSDPFSVPNEAPAALRQAQWAIEVARGESRPVVRYGERRADLGPRTVEEARDLVERILGALIAYDVDHGTELVRTLDVFLDANRSWQRAAERLIVHKQTVTYRVRRIEQLTGRRVNDTGDVAALWLALRARDILR